MKYFCRLDHGEPDDFQGALRTCRHWTDHDAVINEFLNTYEDWSLLLTVERLNYLLSLDEKIFSHKIWVNAVWFENKWYQILRVTDEHRFIREYIEDGDAVEISPTELEKVKFTDAQFNTGDSLVYSPFHDQVFKRSKGFGKFSYICTHKREYKKLVDVTIQIIDENDNPISAFLWVDDKVGIELLADDGKFKYDEVEIGTEFMLSAGYSPMKDKVETKKVVVSEGMQLPIEFKLASHKVIFCISI